MFKMFLRTMKMSDKELYNIFFQKGSWITNDMKMRFDKTNPSALEELLEIVDNRVQVFDKNRLINIFEQSSKVNHVENDEKYIKYLNYFCDYFKIKRPARLSNGEAGEIN